MAEAPPTTTSTAEVGDEGTTDDSTADWTADFLNSWAPIQLLCFVFILFRLMNMHRDLNARKNLGAQAVQKKSKKK
jgi:hypothetical protein